MGMLSWSNSQSGEVGDHWANIRAQMIHECSCKDMSSTVFLLKITIKNLTEISTYNK